MKTESTKWWDGYENQPVVICDEPKATYGWGHLLQLLDRYPCTVETKGGSSAFQAKLLIFVANFNPEEIFGHTPNFAALKRRLNLILKFTGNIYTHIIN